MLLTKNHIFFIQVKLRMLPNEGQGNEKPSQEQPSTSTTTEKPKWLQKLGAVGLTDEKLIEQREKFKQAIRHRCQQLKEKYDGLDWELPPVVQRRLAKWRQGWQRVLAIFPSESAGQGQIHQPPSLEWRLLQSSFWISGTIGFLHGGNTSVGESARRFELYAVGKNFGTLGYAMRRQTDYVVSRYFMRGFSKGALTAGTVCTIVGLVLGTTAYRDCYSLLYVPISAVSVLSVYTFSRGLGLAGLYAALWIAIVPSSILTAATLGGCWYAGTGVDEGYKRLRAIHHEEAMQKEEERAQLAQYMRSRKHFFVPWAKRRMREEKALGTWEPANTEEGNENQELVKFVEQLERAEAEEEGEKEKK